MKNKRAWALLHSSQLFQIWNTNNVFQLFFFNFILNKLLISMNNNAL